MGYVQPYVGPGCTGSCQQQREQPAQAPGHGNQQLEDITPFPSDDSGVATYSTCSPVGQDQVKVGPNLAYQLYTYPTDTADYDANIPT